MRRSRRVRTPNKKYEFVQQMLQRRTPSKEKLNNKNESDESISRSEEDDFIESDQIIKPSETMFAKSDVDGGDLFAFRTPKKRDGMMKLAENTPKTPTTQLKSMSLNTPNTPKTPSAALKALRLQNTPNTPKTPKTTHTALQRAIQSGTPYEIRNKMKHVLQKRAQKTIAQSESESSADEHSDYAAEESSDENSDDDSAVDSSDEEIVPKSLANARKVVPSISKATKIATPQMTIRTRGRSKKKICDDDFIPDSDNYFIAASNKKVNGQAEKRFSFYCLFFFLNILSFIHWYNL